MAKAISHGRLLELLHYDPESGVFTWRVRRGRMKAGAVAGALSPSTGYWEIRIDHQHYYGHRLAWFIIFGTWPGFQIDHRDHIRSNNAIGNLRQATKAQNMQNAPLRSDNTSGYKGVHWNKQCCKWHVQIKINGRQTYVGLFSDINDAANAYRKLAIEHFGEYAYAP